MCSTQAIDTINNNTYVTRTYVGENYKVFVNFLQTIEVFLPANLFQYAAFKAILQQTTKAFPIIIISEQVNSEIFPPSFTL